VLPPTLEIRSLQNQAKKENYMATQAQLKANRENSQLSTGATSDAGREASSRNNLKHGLCHTEEFFTLLPGESEQNFATLVGTLRNEYMPQDTTESILVRRMAESEWLRARAVRLQTDTLFYDQIGSPQKLALFLRYQTTHERAFYKALNELQKLRKERTKAEIGFESQKLKQAAESRSAEALNLKKDALNLKKAEFEFKKETIQTKKESFKAPSAPEISSGDLEIAA
jgi:hypothetical protein